MITYCQYDIQNVVLFYVFLMSSGGGDVMNLVYGSSSSSYMDCEVRCVSSVTIGLIRIRF